MVSSLIDLLFSALPDQPGVRIKGQSLMVRDKMFAYVKAGDLVIKLPAEQVQKLLGRQHFSPLVMGKNVMKEWVVVTRANTAAYITDLPLLKDSIKFVSGS